MKCFRSQRTSLDSAHYQQRQAVSMQHQHTLFFARFPLRFSVLVNNRQGAFDDPVDLGIWAVVEFKLFHDGCDKKKCRLFFVLPLVFYAALRYTLQSRWERKKSRTRGLDKINQWQHFFDAESAVSHELGLIPLFSRSERVIRNERQDQGKFCSVLLRTQPEKTREKPHKLRST